MPDPALDDNVNPVDLFEDGYTPHQLASPKNYNAFTDKEIEKLYYMSNVVAMGDNLLRKWKILEKFVRGVAREPENEYLVILTGTSVKNDNRAIVQLRKRGTWNLNTVVSPIFFKSLIIKKYGQSIRSHISYSMDSDGNLLEQ